MNQEIEKLKKRMLNAMRSGNMSLAVNIQNQIKSFQESRINQPVSEIMQEMPKEDIKKASSLCRKIPVYADLLQGVAVELQSVLQRTDSSIKLNMMDDINKLSAISSRVVSIVSSLNDDEFTESFCELSDRINLIVDNVFSEQEARLNKKNN